MYQQRPPIDRTRVAAAPSLLAQVLGITAVGFLITACAAYLFRDVPSGMGLVGSIGGLVLLFAMSAVRGNPQMQLLLFYAFTFLEGIGIAPQKLTKIEPSKTTDTKRNSRLIVIL